MLIGYARHFPSDEIPQTQIEALASAGVERLMTDQGAHGVARPRPGLEKALSALGRGDVLVTWRLDRLGRSLPDLLAIAATIEAKGAHLRCLCERIDTTAEGGRLVFHVLASLAQFDRTLLRERTREGVEAARARGQHLGRPKALTAEQKREAAKLVASGSPVAVVARTLGVGRDTVYRALRAGEA